MFSPFTQKFIFFLTIPLVFLAFISFSNLQKSLREDNLNQLKAHLLELSQHQAARLAAQLDKVVAITHTTANVVAINHPIPAQHLYEMLKSNLDELPSTYGAAIAYAPYRYEGQKRFAPYVFHGKKELQYIEIFKDSYDYTHKKWQWWQLPKALGKGSFTAPYFDKGAGNILMVTYSTPFFINKAFAGVTTLDLDLNKLHQSLDLKTLKGRQHVILTNTGHFAYHYKKSLIGQSYFELLNKIGLPKALVLGKKMVAGESGFYEIKHEGEKEWVFYAPIGEYGWSFALRTSEKEALALAQNTNDGLSLWLLLFIILSLALTHIVAKLTVIKPFSKLLQGLKALNDGDPKALQQMKLPSLMQGIIDASLKQYAFYREEKTSEKVKQEQLHEQLESKNIQLKENEQRLKSLLESTQKPYIHANKAGEILHANERFKALLSKADLEGNSLQSFISSKQKQNFSKQLQALFENLSPQEISSLNLLKEDETEVPCALMLYPVILEESDHEAILVFSPKETK